MFGFSHSEPPTAASLCMKQTSKEMLHGSSSQPTAPVGRAWIRASLPSTSNFTPAPPVSSRTAAILLAATSLGHAGLDGARSLATKFLQFLHQKIPRGLRMVGVGAGYAPGVIQHRLTATKTHSASPPQPEGSLGGNDATQRPLPTPMTPVGRTPTPRAPPAAESELVAPQN